MSTPKSPEAYQVTTGGVGVVQVGLHSGPLAGAIVGSYRSFYCLYGDTINTAARMCKHARMDYVHASPAFSADARKAAAWAATVYRRWPGGENGGVEEISRGVTVIKGKGSMETFDLTTRSPVLRDHFLHEQVRFPHCEKQANLSYPALNFLTLSCLPKEDRGCLLGDG